ncbi:hypothetical protein JNB_05420 [Janibacter sp. HTCC2649]|nr:hypothetical protein JNB_05420 [Janibacter sp. HTCC2649]
MEDEGTERLHEAREDMDRTLQRLESMPAAQEQEASSAEGLVRVRIDGQGRVMSIVVSHVWAQSLTTAELGPAILEAYLGAGVSQVEEWNSHLEVAMELPEPQTRPFPTQLQSEVAEFAGGDSVTEVEVLERLLEVWSEVEHELDSTIAEVTAGASRQHEISSFQGEVKVVCSATGSLESLTLSEGWLRRSHPANIGRLVLATITDAQNAALTDFSHTQEVAARGTAELQRLGDPDYLHRRLGIGH